MGAASFCGERRASFFSYPFSRKRYSGQHGPEGNAIIVTVMVCFREVGLLYFFFKMKEEKDCF